MIYLLIVNIAMAIGFGVYQLFFKRLTFFQMNRFYLLGMVIIALLIPIGIYIDLSAYFVKEEILPTVHFEAIDDVTVYVSPNNSSFYLMDLLNWIYYTGIGISIIVFCGRLWKLRKAFQYNSLYSSFSFFNKVVLGSKVKSIRVISDHEMVHVEQGHSYDIVFMELVSIFNWFNPMVYYIKRELKFQHECIADEICSTDKVSYAELLLAHAMKTDVNMLRHEFSNQSFLKKRIMMLFKNKSTHNKKYLYLSVLPLVGVIVFSTLVFNTSKAKEIVREVESRVEEVKLPTNSLKVDNLTSSNNYFQEDTTKNRRNNKPNGNSPDKIFESPEILPEPPGGMVAFRKWIGDNYQYPQAAIDAGLKGTIQASFIVEKDGRLSDFEIIRDLGHGTGEAAVEMLKNAPKWSPAIHRGKPVRVQYTLPIKLDLTSGELEKKEQSSVEYERVEVIPEPKGGFQAFRKFVGDHFSYPKDMLSAKELGKVELSFVIDKEGNPTNFRVINETNKVLGKELERVITKYGTWAPAILNGQKSAFSYSLVVDLSVIEGRYGVIKVGDIKKGDFIKS